VFKKVLKYICLLLTDGLSLLDVVDGTPTDGKYAIALKHFCFILLVIIHEIYNLYQKVDFQGFEL
jgi:hypothetical protein